MIRNPDGWWINTECFREASKAFQANGVYTPAPWGSYDWHEYWAEELRRCIEGYSVGGARITGHHYFYLNYAPILRTNEETQQRKTRKRKVDFPDFWDGQYDYFHSVEIARYGITEEELTKLQLEVRPLSLEGGKHILIGKARQKGFSFINGAIAANTYNTVRNSLVLLCAYERKYLYPRGTMQMTSDYMNFLNDHTGWAKKRSVDQMAHKKSGFWEEKDGVLVERGYKSEVMALTFQDNPSASRGKTPEIALLEECGYFINLKDAYMAIRPSVMSGDFVTGLLILQGTGGDMEGGTIDFADMFYNPDPYDILPFQNIWDKDVPSDSKCSFFFPDDLNKEKFIDRAGNSLRSEARAANLARRKTIIDSSTGANTLRKFTSEHPLNPQEAFDVTSKIFFPTQLLKKQLNRLKTDPYLRGKGQPVLLYRDNGRVVARPDLEGVLQPIEHYPNKDYTIKGCPIIYEFPEPNPPFGFYKMGYDPVYQDDSLTDSLASCYVYKGFGKYSGTKDTIVAEFTGRHDTTEENHEIVLMLAELYNAELMFENQVKDVYTYAKTKRKLHYLAAQPDSVINAHIKDSKVKRIFGTHMTAQLRSAGEKYLNTWLSTERDFDEEENVLYNTDYIFSIPTLEELIMYDGKGNFDRVDALIMLMFVIEEEKMQVGEVRKATSVDETLKELNQMMTKRLVTDRQRYGVYTQ